MLLLPENVSLASDRNETWVGTLYGGSSTMVDWDVVFTQNGTYRLSVLVSGLLDGEHESETTRRTAIIIGDEDPFTMFGSYLRLSIIAACVSLVAVGFYLIRRMKRKEDAPEEPQPTPS
ncbi:MAG: hypothetical protein JSV35_07905 [Candidatus Bathyarchaeota archaeon]|nr:MAG: hypothetical protein JSV35_07905 [Candidatus Bathyarchaeota archaeon]